MEFWNFLREISGKIQGISFSMQKQSQNAGNPVFYNLGTKHIIAFGL